MSTIDKWSQLDHGKTAHWWLGNEGTACGRDFRADLRRADLDMPLCRKCSAHPAAVAWISSANSVPTAQEGQ